MIDVRYIEQAFAWTADDVTDCIRELIPMRHFDGAYRDIVADLDRVVINQLSQLDVI